MLGVSAALGTMANALETRGAKFYDGLQRSGKEGSLSQAMPARGVPKH